MFWLVVMLKDKAKTQTGFDANCLRFYFRFFIYLTLLLIQPSTLRRFPIHSLFVNTSHIFVALQRALVLSHLTKENLDCFQSAESF